MRSCGPSSRGSVITPVRALAAHVSGEARKTWALGGGDERLQRVQVELQHAVVLGCAVGAQLGPVLAALLGLHVLPGLIVGWEDRRGGAKLCAHIGDRAALGDGQVGNSGAAVL